MKLGSNTQLQKRPRVPFAKPATCLTCSQKEGYQVARITKDIEFRGETLSVSYECSRCENCGEQVLTPAQMEARLRETVATFQRRKGLMTAGEVGRRRRSLGFASQQELASAHPAIAIATLKRIEAGQHAQDPSTDFILRRAFDELEDRRFLDEATALLRAKLPAPTTEETLQAEGGSAWETMRPRSESYSNAFLVGEAGVTATVNSIAPDWMTTALREEAFVC